MPLTFRYSEWDGTQTIPSLDADDVLEALSDDLMNFGDLQHALRNLMQRGTRTPQGDRMQGLRDILQRLRQMRRQRLDQYDMGGVMDDIRRQLEEILEMERDTLRDRMGEAGEQGLQDQQPGDGQQGRSEQGQDAQGDQPQGLEGMDGEGDADGHSADGEADMGTPGQAGRRQPGAQAQRGQQQRGQRGQSSPQSGQPSGSPQSGEPGDGSEPGQSGEQGQAGGGQQSPEQQFQEMLQRIAQRKQDFLDGLPQDAPGQMKELQNYEFLNPEAQHKFQ
ncbi:MAG: hypothetical protein DWG77_02825, partial [Chloroflexi bacterium]|nr:hypothetical protein [Chloroflexota bacterium]